MPEERKEISVKVNGKDMPVKEIVKEDTEVAATLENELEEKPFKWVLPNEGTSPNGINYTEKRDAYNEEYSQSYTRERMPGIPIHRKKNRLSLNSPSPRPQRSFRIPKQLIVPIGGAVVVGCLIGLIVLMIFAGSGFDSQTTAPVAATPVENPVAPVGKESINLTIVPYIIQGGLFSTPTNGQQLVDKLKKSGFAAIMDPTDNRVLVGIGSSYEAVQELKGDYKKILPDAYAPQGGWPIEASKVSVPEGSELKWLVDGKKLYEKLISVNSSSSQNYNTEIKKWKTNALSSIATLRDKEDQEKAVAFINSISTIPRATSSTDFQQALLDTLIAYKTLVGTFNNN